MTFLVEMSYGTELGQRRGPQPFFPSPSLLNHCRPSVILWSPSPSSFLFLLTLVLKDLWKSEP